MPFLYSLEDDPHLGYYLVMRYLEGETLDAFLLRKDTKRSGLPLEQTVAILTPVARALDYAHRNDVIHRDVKPSNIFLVKTDKGIEVQLIDFGLADEIRSSLNRVSQVRGGKARPRRTSRPGRHGRGVAGGADCRTKT